MASKVILAKLDIILPKTNKNKKINPVILKSCLILFIPPRVVVVVVVVVVVGMWGIKFDGRVVVGG